MSKMKLGADMGDVGDMFAAGGDRALAKVDSLMNGQKPSSMGSGSKNPGDGSSGAMNLLQTLAVGLGLVKDKFGSGPPASAPPASTTPIQNAGTRFDPSSGLPDLTKLYRP